MSVAKAQLQEKRDGKRGKRGTRGEANTANRLKAFKAEAKAGEAEWATCDAAVLLAVVDLITGLGGAITLGLSRDQGAHFLTLLLDDAKETLWFNGDADLTIKLHEVMVTLEDM